MRGVVGEPRHISRIEIAQFLGVRDLSVDVPAPPDPRRGQWIVVLGENLSGKTTLLRAVVACLALSSRNGHYLAKLFSPAAGGSRPPRPSAAVTWRGRRWAWKATLDGSDVVMERDPELGARGPLVFAYGTQRGTALGGPRRDVPLTDFDEVGTLFPDGGSLVHADTWLRDLAFEAATTKDASLFDAVKATLLRVLPDVERIDVDADATWVTVDGARRPLEALSDGYLTTIGWVVDLLARWVHRRRVDKLPIRAPFHDDIDAIVLVDEIDLHLHPRWQTQVIDRLRATFPRASFIVTTHSPLTLHGARPGEVVVLERDGDAIHAVQRDVPAGLRADQILTGAWFGMRTTLRPETQALIDRHQALLLQGKSPSDPAVAALQSEIRTLLGSFAETSLENLVLQVAADVVGTGAPITPAARDRIQAVVSKRLAHLRSALDTPLMARDSRRPRETAGSRRPAAAKRARSKSR